MNIRLLYHPFLPLRNLSPMLRRGKSLFHMKYSEVLGEAVQGIPLARSMGSHQVPGAHPERPKSAQLHAAQLCTHLVLSTGFVDPEMMPEVTTRLLAQHPLWSCFPRASAAGALSSAALWDRNCAWGHSCMGPWPHRSTLKAGHFLLSTSEKIRALFKHRGSVFQLI